MKHLDEGILVALRDGDSPDGRAEEHLHGCAECADALLETKRRSQGIAEALTALDEPVDILRAKAAVRRRLDSRRDRGRATTGSWWHAHLGRAAALLVLTAGAASALPWSPVRHWWVDAPTGTPASGAAAAVEPTVATQDAPAAGISVGVPEGRIRVVVTNAGPGTVIEVRWVERATARVSAPSGSGFTYADGRAEVDAASGPIEVELPRDAVDASLVVNGRIFLERVEGRLDVPGPAVDRADTGIRFVVPAI